MLPSDIFITEELVTVLKSLIKNNPVDGKALTVEKLSKKIGRNKDFFYGVQSMRKSTIKSKDVVKIYMAILGCDEACAIKRIEHELSSIISKHNNGKIFLSDAQRNRMKKIRKAKKIRSDVLSVEIGKSKNWYCSFENRRIKRTEIEVLELIAEKLECSIQDIIGDENNNERAEKDIYIENSILKQENEMLKAKLQSIMEIVKRIDLEKE